MRPMPPVVSAVVELESRQDEVLRRLEELEAQVERALLEFTAVLKREPLPGMKLHIAETSGPEADAA